MRTEILHLIWANCVAKDLTKILRPLVGKSPHHITSTQDFVEQTRHITLAPGECLSSNDMSALFTSVPVDLFLKVIKDLLEKDPTLKERTVLPLEDITLLLEICLKNIYIIYNIIIYFIQHSVYTDIAFPRALYRGVIFIIKLGLKLILKHSNKTSSL